MITNLGVAYQVNRIRVDASRNSSWQNPIILVLSTNILRSCLIFQSFIERPLSSSEEYEFHPPPTTAPHVRNIRSTTWRSPSLPYISLVFDRRGRRPYRGTMRIFRTLVTPTMPRESSWKARDKMGGGTSKRFLSGFSLEAGAVGGQRWR